MNNKSEEYEYNNQSLKDDGRDNSQNYSETM